MKMIMGALILKALPILKLFFGFIEFSYLHKLDLATNKIQFYNMQTIIW